MALGLDPGVMEPCISPIEAAHHPSLVRELRVRLAPLAYAVRTHGPRPAVINSLAGPLEAREMLMCDGVRPLFDRLRRSGQTAPLVAPKPGRYEALAAEAADGDAVTSDPRRVRVWTLVLQLYGPSARKRSNPMSTQATQVCAGVGLRHPMAQHPKPQRLGRPRVPPEVRWIWPRRAGPSAPFPASPRPNRNAEGADPRGRVRASRHPAHMRAHGGVRPFPGMISRNRPKLHKRALATQQHPQPSSTNRG